MTNRENSNGNGSIPWQVKAIATIGVPSVVALYLVYILAGKVEGAVTRAESSAARAEVVMANHIRDSGWQQEREERRDYLLLQICVAVSQRAPNSAGVDCYGWEPPTRPARVR